VSEGPPERSAATPETARHLTDLDARYDTHLAALRKTAAELQAGSAHEADALDDAAPADLPDRDPVDS